MPQVFQVLRCYKCLIFQVHQTKKDNKWRCKVCGEKQSVKRHYGIGTAKDCRVHVQKLNNMQGDKEESKLKPADSDSEYDSEDNRENDHKTQILTDNAKTENKSKWSTYIEKEDISAVVEPEYINNIEVCLEPPQKRKINRRRNSFKVPKVFNDYDEKAEIGIENSNNLPTFNNDNFNGKENSTDLYYESSARYQFSKIKKKNKVMNVSTNFQTNKASKWAQYESNEIKDHCRVVETEGNTKYYDAHIDDKNDEPYCHQKEDTVITDDDGASLLVNGIENGGTLIVHDVENNYHYKETENDHSSITMKPMFSLCDDKDLDEVLDF